MSVGTVQLDDLTRALLLAQRAALMAALPLAIERPSLKAGAVMWLGVLEDELGIERTIPRRDERRAVRLQSMIE